MHEGLKVDPVTGFDEGPRLSRWLPSVKALTTTFAVLWLVASFSRLQEVWMIPLVLVVMCGACTLILGLEARALSRCVGADTSASRQLRWERAIMFGVVGLFGSLSLGGLMFADTPRFSPPLVLRIPLGIACFLNLAGTLVGLGLAWRHRPDRVGPAEHPGPAQRR